MASIVIFIQSGYDQARTAGLGAAASPGNTKASALFLGRLPPETRPQPQHPLSTFPSIQEYPQWNSLSNASEMQGSSSGSRQRQCRGHHYLSRYGVEMALSPTDPSQIEHIHRSLHESVKGHDHSHGRASRQAANNNHLHSSSGRFSARSPTLRPRSPTTSALHLPPRLPSSYPAPVPVPRHRQLHSIFALLARSHTNKTSLRVPKRKQRHSHDGHANAQTRRDVADEKVGRQGDEPT